MRKMNYARAGARRPAASSGAARRSRTRRSRCASACATARRSSATGRSPRARRCSAASGSSTSPSRDEAIEIAKRAPAARWGTVEVHAVRSRCDVPGRREGHALPLRVPHGAGARRLRRREAARDARVRRGARAPRTSSSRPRRSRPSRRRRARRGARREGARHSTGPSPRRRRPSAATASCAPTSAAEALAIAKRYPHARWGPLEVREILFLDRVRP